MAKEFEMTDIDLMSYYLGIEIKQNNERIFMPQENYAKEILKKLYVTTRYFHTIFFFFNASGRLNLLSINKSVK